MTYITRNKIAASQPVNQDAEPWAEVGPHEFDVLRGLDRLILGSQRCRACYLPKSSHPVTGWTTARWEGDRSPAHNTETERSTGTEQK